MMEMFKVLDTTVIKYTRIQAWRTFSLVIILSSLSISAASGCIVAWGLKEAITTTRYHEQQIRELTAEAQKWSIEAGKCADHLGPKRGKE